MKASDTLFSDLPNPKQNGSPILGRHTWYPYYAGYSPIFVQKVLERANPTSGAVICDPWNGAGTTTQVAHDLGYPAVGFDLNPVMVVVARSRSMTPSQIPTLRKNLDEIVRRVHSYHSAALSKSDPLNLWLQPCATIAVRHIENAIREEHNSIATKAQEESQPWDVSRELAFYFTAVFRCLFRLSKNFRTSNPTWLKIPRNPESRLSFSTADLISHFNAEATKMLSSLEEEPPLIERTSKIPELKIDVASSDELPLNNQAVDLVITSPPYCTRIDYAVSTSLELAFLGFDYDISIRKLRQRMIGTPTVRAILPEENSRWGRTCYNFLTQVRNHFSKASQSYYLKTHLQYFHDIYLSLLEIDRVLRSGGDCVFVVQDSYYKDIRNDLAAMIEEMASLRQWAAIGRQDFPVRLNIARVNRLSRHYRPSYEPIESALWFKVPVVKGLN